MSVSVYVLQTAATGRRYVGITANLRRRMAEHNSGQCSSTRNDVPWRLIYREDCADHAQAREREKFLKSGQGREYLRKILARKLAPASSG